ncbi:MAG: BrnT family toxin [Pseudomonadaceae bacterium]|nr:BrnT family toxin [Pseudomonadaceae bacterium]
MKQINWNAEKNQLLMVERGVSFEDVVFAIQSEKLLDDGPHPNKEKYPNQRIFVVQIDSYAWLVPYVENDTEIFLKTIIPSRKATKRFIEVSYD